MTQSPLWTERHSPDISEFKQDDVRRRLSSLSDSKMNIIISGPKGVGKSAAARALLKESHENREDTVNINIKNLFEMTKKEMRNDGRFSDILEGKSRMSKRDMINEVIKSLSSTPSVTGEYKTMLLENAEYVRKDFQQSLRRIIERHSDACRFVLTTRDPSSLISPIRSRFHLLHIRPPNLEESVNILSSIGYKEGVDCDDKTYEYIWSKTRPNVREAILLLQTANESGDLEPSSIYETLEEVSDREDIIEILDLAQSNEFREMRKAISKLLSERGYSGQSLIQELVNVSSEEYSESESAQLASLAGDLEFRMSKGNDDKIHIINLLSSWSTKENNH